MEGTKLEQCGSKYKDKSIKFLGILVDDKLNWAEHINMLRNTLRSQITDMSLINGKETLPASHKNHDAQSAIYAAYKLWNIDMRSLKRPPKH